MDEGLLDERYGGGVKAGVKPYEGGVWVRGGGAFHGGFVTLAPNPRFKFRIVSVFESSNAF